jgi:hypothetical protein
LKKTQSKVLKLEKSLTCLQRWHSPDICFKMWQSYVSLPKLQLSFHQTPKVKPAFDQQKKSHFGWQPFGLSARGCPCGPNEAALHPEFLQRLRLMFSPGCRCYPLVMSK